MNDEYELSNIMSLEKQLERSLMPVKPDPVFRKRLRSRLNTSPVVFVETSEGLKANLMIGMGLVFGVLLFWLIKRYRRS